jgi:hypothetical protein
MAFGARSVEFQSSHAPAFDAERSDEAYKEGT